MKNIKKDGWKRTVDTGIDGVVDYDKALSADIHVTVHFDDFDNSFEVATSDTGTYENDVRIKATGKFENTSESILEILSKAENVKHFSRNQTF